MNNKVLVNIYISLVDQNYNVYISINERLVTIIDEFIKGINKITDDEVIIDKEKIVLLNMKTGQQYSLDKIVYNTDIRNGTKLMLI